MEVLLLETTCSCTVATLKTEAGEKKKVTVAPGGSTPIEVNWEAASGAGSPRRPRSGRTTRTMPPSC